MIKRLETMTKKIIFADEERGFYYRRIVGGLGWPAENKPGYLVVLGEDLVEVTALMGRRLWVLAEQEGAHLEDLHRGCLELRLRCKCDFWLADREQLVELRLFRRLTQDKSLGEMVGVNLRTAPYSQAGSKLAVLAQILASVTNAERKLLTFGADSNLPAALRAVSAEDLKKEAGNFPSLAALGYAVAEMILREPADTGKWDQVRNTWDPYNLEA